MKILAAATLIILAAIGIPATTVHAEKPDIVTLIHSNPTVEVDALGYGPKILRGKAASSGAYVTRFRIARDTPVAAYDSQGNGYYGPEFVNCTRFNSNGELITKQQGTLGMVVC